MKIFYINPDEGNVLEWCIENFGDPDNIRWGWVYSDDYFYRRIWFSDEIDAMAVKMRR